MVDSPRCPKNNETLRPMVDSPRCSKEAALNVSWWSLPVVQRKRHLTLDGGFCPLSRKSGTQILIRIFPAVTESDVQRLMVDSSRCPKKKTALDV